MKLFAVPIALDEANSFVENFHRHSQPTIGHRFSIGCSDGDGLVGVAIVGRPVARKLQDGWTAEVLRCCVLEHRAPKGACSFLYAACWRAWRAMGGRKLITYTLKTESGASLRGAGMTLVAELPGNDPAMWQSRPYRDWNPTVGQAKFRWEFAL